MAILSPQTKLRLSLGLSIARSIIIGLCYLPFDLLTILRVTLLPPSADVSVDAAPQRKTIAQHEDDVQHLAAQLSPSRLKGRLVTMGKKSRGAGHTGRSNLYKDDTYQLDISNMNCLLEINPSERYAIVEPGVSISSLATEALKHGLLPPVIPELRKITIGGAIQGLGVESTSIHYGLLDTHIIDADLLVPNADNGQPGLITRQQDPELWATTVGSCGSLSIVTQAKVALIPASKWFAIRYVRYDSHEGFVKECLAKREAAEQRGMDCAERGWFGPCLVADAIVFETCTIGMFGGCVAEKDKNAWTGDTYCGHPGRKLFFEHVQEIAGRKPTHTAHSSIEKYGSLIHTELMPTLEYAFRYDRGGFWAAHILGDYLPWLGSLLNQPLLRTLLHSILDTPTQMQLARMLSDASREDIGLFQDLGVPMTEDKGAALNELLEWLDDVRPVWLCPIRNGDKTSGARKRVFATSDKDQSSLEMDVGLYGRPVRKLKQGKTMRDIGREMEVWMRKYDGHKGLYGFTYAEEAEFNEWYDMNRYNEARTRYGSDQAFPRLYQKVKR